MAKVMPYNYMFVRYLSAILLGLCTVSLSGCGNRDEFWYYGGTQFSSPLCLEFRTASLEPHKGATNLYVKFGNIGPVRCNAITQELLRNGLTRSDPGDDRTSISLDNHIFVFRDGVLEGALFRASKGRLVSFSRGLNGPWVTLPASGESLRKALGKPDSVGSAPTSVR